MKSKLFSLFAFSLFAAVFLVGLASAALSLTASPTSIDLTESNSSKTLTINGNDNFNITGFDPTLTVSDGEGHSATITITNSSDITDVSSATFDISIDDFSDFELGDYDPILTINAENATNPSDIDNISIIITTQKGLCDCGNLANLDVKIDSIDVKEGFGDDEDYWYPLDEIEIDVEIESPDYDVEDIEIGFCLYDITEDKCILDEGDIDISEDDFDLDENDDITTTLSFKVDPDELYSGDNDYTIYVKATGTIDSDDANDGEETCASDSQDIEIRTDEKFVILDDIKMPDLASCGEKVELTASVWNVGDEDIDDDEIFLRIYNYELGINKVVEFASGIDLMDYEAISFIFDIPEDAEEETHSILVTAYDDEDMYDKHIYENKEDDKAEYKIFLRVSDCTVQPEVSVSANLESEAKAGKEMNIKITLKNTGSDTRTFIVNAENYGAWAEVSEIPGTLTINSGSSGETYVKLNVNKDASGEKTFNILVYEGTELITSQPVSVNIEPRSFLGITGLAINGNSYLWGLGLLNIILVVVIIIVAVRVARRK